jgi:hypothetical protein
MSDVLFSSGNSGYSDDSNDKVNNKVNNKVDPNTMLGMREIVLHAPVVDVSYTSLHDSTIVPVLHIEPTSEWYQWKEDAQPVSLEGPLRTPMSVYIDGTWYSNFWMGWDTSFFPESLNRDCIRRYLFYPLFYYPMPIEKATHIRLTYLRK